MSYNQSRKWLITINNPVDKGFTHAKIKEILEKIAPVAYWCMSDEIGKKGTYHTHIYIACSSPLRFTTVTAKFKGGNCQSAHGTSQENKAYIFKEGKWEKDAKKSTNLTDTHEEWGEMPQEQQGKRNDLTTLYDLIKSGKSNYEIIDAYPGFMLKIDYIEKIRQMIREDEYKEVFRDIQTTYIYGETGAGKTSGVMKEYGFANIYRITDYDHPFDGYKGQDVIIFEEFRSSLKIQDMLNYLDGYPLTLPCRYANRVACFTKIYVITNIPLEEQYKTLQKEQKETWQAFLRRIHFIKNYTKGVVEERTMKVYLEEQEKNEMERMFTEHKK